MIKEYIAYLKNNPDHLWFKRKLYGWGWTPATKEGWFAILAYLAAIFFVAFRLGEEPTTDELWWQFIAPLVVLTALLIFICYKKGEKPRWQWGLPPDHRDDE